MAKRLPPSRQLSFDELRSRSRRGGARVGAGRPRGAGARVPHRERGELKGPCPAHVTIRIRRGLPSLRCRALVREFQRSLRASCERGDFRVLQYSLQRDHAHLLFEADSVASLACGMKSIGARLARAVNRTFGHTGAVFDGRFHLHALRTPREVHAALAYVLLNARRHWTKRFGNPPPVRLDEASSSRWFTGWAKLPFENAAPPDIPEVAAPHTRLARVGWRRHGPIDPAAVPGCR